MATSIVFKSSEGKEFTGDLINAPGFEGVDLVMVRNGFFCEVYELTTGMQVMTAQGFTEVETMDDLRAAFIEKGWTGEILMKKIADKVTSRYGLTKALTQVNPSPAYEAYLAKKQAAYDATPFAYTDEQRDQILEWVEIANKAGATSLSKVTLANHSLRKTGGRFPSIEEAKKIFDWGLKRHQERAIRLTGEKLTIDLRINWEVRGTEWQDMINYIHMGRKRDMTRYIPQDLLTKYYGLWAVCMQKNNVWGYVRFSPHGGVAILRVAIDTKKDRDVTEDIKEINDLIDFHLPLVLNETQRYYGNSDDGVYISESVRIKNE